MMSINKCLVNQVLILSHPQRELLRAPNSTDNHVQAMVTGRTSMTIIFLIYTHSFHSQELYHGCGTRNVVCVGGSGGYKAFNNSGCIKEKSCDVFLRAQMIHTSYDGSTDPRFEWLLAVRYDKSKTSGYRFHTLFISVTDRSYQLVKELYMPMDIPYWSLTKEDSPLDHFKAQFRSCDASRQNQECDEDLRASKDENYIIFEPMRLRTFTDTELIYMTSIGGSRQKMEIEYLKPFDGNGYNIDLINDDLTITLWHWHAKDKQPWAFNHAGNFDPFRLFCCEYVPTTEVIRDEKEFEAMKVPKKSLMWLWILLGILGFLTTILIIFQCFCNTKKKDDVENVEEAKSPTTGGPLKPKRTKSPRSIMDEDGRENKHKHGRLNYIANLAGYTPGQPVLGKKDTQVKTHDFDKPYQSDQSINYQ